jgi:hypothetical protein
MLYVSSAIAAVVGFYAKFESVITKTAGVILFIAAIFGAYTGWHSINDTPTKIIGHYSRYEFPKVVTYSGEISNDDDKNADDFTFKGTFQSEINEFDIDTPDIYENKKFKETTGVVQFSMKRLSSGNRCKFDIFVNPIKEKNGGIQISWHGGKTQIEFRDVDTNLVRAIALSEKARSFDISHRARRTWLERNSKNIGGTK